MLLKVRSHNRLQNGSLDQWRIHRGGAVGAIAPPSWHRSRSRNCEHRISAARSNDKLSDTDVRRYNNNVYQFPGLFGLRQT